MSGRMNPQLVYAATAPSTDYGARCGTAAPELNCDCAGKPATVALRNLFRAAGLDEERAGSEAWNPLGELVRPGERVLVKPNWVRHALQGLSSIECLVTHTSVLAGVLHYLVKARPSQIVVGDAPIQGCDFERLRQQCRIDELKRHFEGCGVPIEIADFRLVKRQMWWDGAVKSEGRGESDYYLFDLGRESALEPITSASADFRVTMYPPPAMRQTHAPGQHCYLIAREAIDADVIFSVPKLKTHKKAGITGALKNMVGVNGHKSYLPHHRRGGSAQGGDCYEGYSLLKHMAESLYDAANSATSRIAAPVLMSAATATGKVSRWIAADSNLEGSWYGNDTVWRMCLDLQQIVHYGMAGGVLSEMPQRRVITITDAIIAGEGEGPMDPAPVPLGLLTLAGNVAAAEWLHARLMGFDPATIPLTREAFRLRQRPLAAFGPDQVTLNLDGRVVEPAEIAGQFAYTFRPSAGWIGRCERDRNVARQNCA